MTAVEFANTITDLPYDKQNAFFEALKPTLSEEDYITTLKFIGFIGLFKNQEKYKALRNAISEELFGMECPVSAKTMFEA
ncbi:MAG: hypothetical protein IIV14_00715 [Bacteroidaceae bacterium]|nr:hypothetical protein [Bacteroidaceae bacterium]